MPTSAIEFVCLYVESKCYLPVERVSKLLIKANHTKKPGHMYWTVYDFSLFVELMCSLNVISLKIGLKTFSNGHLTSPKETWKICKYFNCMLTYSVINYYMLPIWLQDLGNTASGMFTLFALTKETFKKIFGIVYCSSDTILDIRITISRSAAQKRVCNSKIDKLCYLPCSVSKTGLASPALGYRTWEITLQKQCLSNTG